MAAREDHEEEEDQSEHKSTEDVETETHTSDADVVRMRSSQREFVAAMEMGDTDEKSALNIKQKLVSAIQNDREDTFEQVLPMMDDLDDVKTPPKRTLLMFATIKNRVGIAKLLLESGAGLLCCGKARRSAFHEACERGYTGLAKMMLEFAKRKDRDIASETIEEEVTLAVDSAAASASAAAADDGGAGAIGSSACDRGSDRDISSSLKPKPKSIVRRLLERRDWNGMTPLLSAVQSARLPIVQMLLDPLIAQDCSLLPKGYTLNVNQTDNDNRSAVYMAVTRKNHRILEELLKCGRCDLNLITKKEGQTALMQACIKGDLTAVKLLMAQDPPPDASLRRRGKSALFMAVSKGEDKIVREMLSHMDMPRLWEISDSNRSVIDYASYGRALSPDLTEELRRQVHAIVVSALMLVCQNNKAVTPDLIRVIAQFTY